MSHRGRRFGAILAALSLVASLVVALAVSSATPAGADTTQNNGCQSSVTGGWSTFPIPLTGTASPDPVNAGSTTTLSGTTVTVVIDSTLVIAGVNAGILQEGVNYVYAKVGLAITGSNTSEATQISTGATKINFTVTIDPVSGAVTVTPVPVIATVNMSSTTWTATGGNITLAEATGPLPASLSAPTPAERNAAPLRILTKIQGTDVAWPPAGPVSPDLTSPAFPPGLGALANFFCWPGTAGPDPLAPVQLVPGTANAIDTVTVNTPATAPVCNNINTSVGGGQSVILDLTAVCTDANGNATIDWNTLGVGFGNPASPTICTAYPCTLVNGTLNVTGVGQLTYTNTNASGGSELFGFSVADTGGLRSTTAVVSIGILANDCTAPCSLSQVVSVQVIGATMTMNQASQFVTLAPVTLNGNFKITNGAIQPITVTNARGTAAGWTVTGQVTDFKTTGAPTGSCNTPAGYNRLCIPANNLGWGPTAGIVHTQIPGDVAVVNPGATGDGLAPWTAPVNGSGSGSTLCTSPDNQSGGTFRCNAIVWLGVPASAGAGTYTGTLTLTLA